jgi:hypothetical protein
MPNIFLSFASTLLRNRRTADRAALRAGLIVCRLCLTVALTACGQLGNAAVPAGSTVAAPEGLSSSLRDGGIAILMPTAPSDNQGDRQTVAQVFTNKLTELRPDLPVIALPKTLSAINAAGLSEPYNRMLGVYRDTGLFDGPTLGSISHAVGARYLVQINIGSFDESSGGGLFGSIVGISLVRKDTGTVRLTAQIWDANEGKIVFEDSNQASEKKRSLVIARTVKMEDVATSAAQEIIKKLPH